MYGLKSSQRVRLYNLALLAAIPTMASFRVDEGGQDGSINFDEAVGQVNGMKLQGPERRPLRSDRTTGEVTIGDLPVRHLDSSATKLEQFADAIMHHPLEVTVTMFDNLYKFSCENKYSNLPEPFNLKKEPSVPYSMQIIIQTAQPPPGGDTDGSYVHIFKHVYLHRNKVPASDCVQMCHGTPLRFDWGNHTRLALTGLNFMLDKMGGKQLRYWFIKPKFEKKISIDQQAREEGYKFIREFGPKANNRNQFMEWTDEQINTPGSKIEGWCEGKVKEALHNHMRGRQNAKTIEHWPFTLKSFTPWFLDNVLSKMLPSMRQHAITWIGRTRTGKSLGSKTVLFCSRNPNTRLTWQIAQTWFPPSLQRNTWTSLKRNPSPDLNQESSVMACCKGWTHPSSRRFSIHPWLDIVSFIRDFGVFICEVCLQFEIAGYTVLDYQESS